MFTEKELQKQKHADLVKLCITYQESIDELKSQISEQPKDGSALQEELTSVKFAAKETEEALNAVIEELRGQLSSVKKEVKAQTKTVAHEGAEYEVKLPTFRHKGKTYKAEDLSDKPALVKELVEMGAGVLVKTEK